MAVYTPSKLPVQTALDDIGLQLGLERLPEEDLASYRKRIYLESRDQGGPTQDDLIRTLGRTVGEFDIKVFQIDLLLGGGVPLATDPRLEVTSSHFRLYSDYENDTVDIELNIASRDETYFLRDLYTAVAASTFFSIVVEYADYTYLKSQNLRFCNSETHVPAESLYSSRSNKLANGHLKDYYFSSPEIFLTEKGSAALLTDAGDYYVDTLNGVVFTRDPARGFITYTYCKFPFDVYWQPVRSYPLNDPDSMYLRYDTLVSDTDGALEYSVLNSLGAEIANEVLVAHPLGWGE